MYLSTLQHLPCLPPSNGDLEKELIAKKSRFHQEHFGWGVSSAPRSDLALLVSSSAQRDAMHVTTGRRTRRSRQRCYLTRPTARIDASIRRCSASTNWSNSAPLSSAGDQSLRASAPIHDFCLVAAITASTMVFFCFALMPEAA